MIAASTSSKIALRGILIAMLLSLPPTAARAQEAEPRFPAHPAGQIHYQDAARVLSPDDVGEIQRTALSLWRDMRVPIYVVILPSLEAEGASDYTVDQYAWDLAEHWRGQGPIDERAMTLLIARDDRQAHIELGPAWEPFRQAQVRKVVQGILAPSLQQKAYGQAVRDGVLAMDALARGNALPQPYPREWVIFFLATGCLFALGVVISLLRSGRKGWGWGLVAAFGSAAYFVLGATASSFSGKPGFSEVKAEGGNAMGTWWGEDF